MLPLHELIMKSWDGMTEYEADVACYQYEAIRLRQELERTGTDLVLGKGGRESFQPSDLEIDSLGLGLNALYKAME